MSKMEHAITQYQDASQTITQKIFIFVGVIAYTVLILKIMTLPTKHALSPLFPGFTVPELDASSRTDDIDPTRMQNIDVSVKGGENNHGFIVEQLEPNVGKHGNTELQMVTEIIEENHPETYSGNDDTKLSAPKIQDMHQQPISGI